MFGTMGQDRTGRFNDLLTLTDVFTVNPVNTLSDILILNNTFTYEHTNSLSDVQTLVELYTVTLNTSRTLSDVLTLKNSFSASTDDPNTIQNPIPPVTNPTENTPPDPGPPPGPGLGPFDIGVQRYVNQNVTFAGGNQTLTIKAPDFGDKETDQPTILNEETRNFVRIQFRDPIWNDFKLYELSWSQLDEDEMASIRVFLRRTCGLGITYTDIYGNAHVGVIPDPDQAASSDDKGFIIKFSFLEGLLAS